MSVKLDLIEFTDEQLDELSIITDADIQIADRIIADLLDRGFKNILLAIEQDLEDAFTNQP